MELKPIALFRCQKKNPYEAARQGSVDSDQEIGEIQFSSGQSFEQALEDLEGFSHLWLIYQFHHNQNWKPKVLPPRGSRKKKGVFATRSPYRPNSLGLSCVELIEQKGLSLFVRSFDLLDGTPVFDIKPYLPYSDSFPHAQTGWLKNIEENRFQVQLSPSAENKLNWLESNGLDQMRNFLFRQLQYEPLNKQKKRLLVLTEDRAILAYRTWRAEYKIHERNVEVFKISSGYTDEELLSSEDKHGDKDLHRRFIGEAE